MLGKSRGRRTRAAPSQVERVNVVHPETEQIVATFKKWDSHGDGYITKAELTTILTHFGFQPADMTAIFRIVDANGNGRIEYEEFVKWLYGEDCPDIVRRNALAPVFQVSIASLSMTICHHHSFDGWWSDSAKIRPFVRFRDYLTDAVFFSSLEGQGLHSEVKAGSRPGSSALIELVEGTCPGVVVELCLARFARSPEVIGFGMILLDDLAASVAAGLGTANLEVQLHIEETSAKAKKRKPSKTAPQGQTSTEQSSKQNSGSSRLVGSVVIHFEDVRLSDKRWAEKKVFYWKQHGFPLLKDMTKVEKALLGLAAVPDRELISDVLETAELHLSNELQDYASFTGDQAVKVLDGVLAWIRRLDKIADQSRELCGMMAPALGRLKEHLGGSVLTASLQGEKADHQLMRPALQFACDLDPHLPELQEVESIFKQLLQFPREVKLNDLLRASDADVKRLEPAAFHLELTTEGSLPSIQDDLRFGVRDETAKRVLAVLGCKAAINANAAATFGKLAFDTISSPDFLMADIVKALLAETRLFIGERLARQSSIYEILSKQKCDREALLGRFDVVAVPVRADFDDRFKAHEKDNLPWPYFGENLEEPIGGPGWFWVFHAAALNIGENENAADFEEYSMPADMAYRGRHGHSRWLDEERYVLDMKTLWLRSLQAAKHLGIEDMIMFPFGMGAFLRNLHKLDNRYSDAACIRRLRYRVALGLFQAAKDICTGCTPPMRIHLCLVESSLESRSNHNVFVEAAAAIVAEKQSLGALLKFHRNCDALELAHRLAAEVPAGRPDMDIAIRKVGLLNGANNKQLGNHWFSRGAKSAIDENLHRRSASMSISSLLLNLSTEARHRDLQELATHVEVTGGKVVEIEPYPQKTEHVRVVSRIVAKTVVVGYGVLGTQMSQDRQILEVVPEPSAQEVIVDPAGLQYIQSSPSGAGGASGQLYRWLGIGNDASFPDPVRQAIIEPLQAKFHSYGSKNVIHVVGPNFQSRSRLSFEDGVAELAQAYRSALREFADSGLQRVRLLPISSSIFAGHFAPRMPEMTVEALHQGFALLDSNAQDRLLAAESVEMCIFMEAELQAFQEAFGR